MPVLRQPVFAMHGWLLLVLLLCVVTPQVVEAVCPWCSGNLLGCTYNLDSKCPSQTIPTSNAAILASGVAATAGTVFTLAGVIKPRWLLAFAGVSLEAIVSLARRPVPGTAFEIKVTTRMGTKWVRGNQSNPQEVLVRTPAGKPGQGNDKTPPLRGM